MNSLLLNLLTWNIKDDKWEHKLEWRGKTQNKKIFLIQINQQLPRKMVVTLPLNWGPLSKSSSMYTLKPSFSKTLFLKSPLLRSSFKPQFFPYTTQTSSPCSSTPLSFSITCKLKTSEDGKSSKSLAKKIVLSEGAPAVSEDGAGNGEAQPKPASKGVAVEGVLGGWWRGSQERFCLFFLICLWLLGRCSLLQL